MDERRPQPLEGPKIIQERPEPASAQPGPGATEPDEPRHRLEFDLIGAVLLSLICGLWLILSPLWLGYGEDDAEWVPVACGTVIAAAALLRMTGVRWIGLNFIVIVVAVGLFLSAFWLADTNIAKWNAMAGGAIALFLAVIGASAMAQARAVGPRGPSY